LLIIDSQAVKNTCTAGIETKGFCHYKCTNGIKRHLAVDTLGIPFFTHCPQANVTDDQGLIEMLVDHLDYFRAKPVNIPKMTILLDHGYHPGTIQMALELFYPQIMTKIRFQLAPKPTKAETAAKGKTGFVPVATRWIIERTALKEGFPLEGTVQESVLMLGWSGARVLSRTMSVPWIMQLLRSTSASSA
jgi:hypothetical protein